MLEVAQRTKPPGPRPKRDGLPAACWFWQCSPRQAIRRAYAPVPLARMDDAKRALTDDKLDMDAHVQQLTEFINDQHNEVEALRKLLSALIPVRVTNIAIRTTPCRTADRLQRSLRNSSKRRRRHCTTSLPATSRTAQHSRPARHMAAARAHMQQDKLAYIDLLVQGAEKAMTGGL